MDSLSFKRIEKGIVSTIHRKFTESDNGPFTTMNVVRKPSGKVDFVREHRSRNGTYEYFAKWNFSDSDTTSSEGEDDAVVSNSVHNDDNDDDDLDDDQHDNDGTKKSNKRKKTIVKKEKTTCKKMKT